MYNQTLPHGDKAMAETWEYHRNVACSGKLRMAQVFFSDRIWIQVVAFKALYCSCATVLVITNVIVNNFVDIINSKYTVAMATSHPATNMAHTWDVLNYISQNVESKERINKLHTNVRISLWSGVSYSKGMRVPLLRMWWWQPETSG